MCGITGIVFGPRHIQPAHTVARMLDLQEHRGPEGHSIDQVEEAIFGYCQLAFVDIGASQQPYRSADSRILLAFNGEIYNHRELRSRLAPSFDTPGEAALLAELYARHGLAMVTMLNGMFAIAIFDARSRETLLVRDRFGKKPLYYFVRGRQVAFASELRALRAHEDAASDLDPAAVGLFMTFNSVPAPHSLVRGIRKVPPGAIVCIRDGAVRVERYWDPVLSPVDQSWGSALDEIDTALRAAVKRRIPREASFGVFLSGGLDSGLVAAIAAEYAHEPLRSFSIGFPDQSYDESAHARAMAAAIGADHQVIAVTMEDLARMAQECLPALDEPIADQSLVPTALLARAARPYAKAVLTGDGADELLMGYRIFQATAALRLARKIMPTKALEQVLLRLGAGRPSDSNLHYTHIATLLARALTEPPERQYYAAAAALPRDGWGALLDPEIMAGLAGLDPFEEIDRLIAINDPGSPAERLQIGMIGHFLRDTILTKLDRSTMLASIEARSPFLDGVLVDAMLRLPARWKLRGFTTKYILKHIAERYLPAALVHRRKQGFRSPTAALLRGPLREWAGDMLVPTALTRAGVFQSVPVERMLGEHLRHEHDHHRTLWPILCLQSWLNASAPHHQSVTKRGL